MRRMNASYSKTYLTRHNYRGPTLLQSIRGRDGDTVAAMKASRKSDEMAPNQNDDNYVFAPPESSGDESDKLPEKASPASPKRRGKRTTSPPAKRSAGTTTSSRPKRLKLQDEPSIETIQVPEDITPVDLFGLPSSGSQKRRHNKGYGRKFQTPAPVEEPQNLRQKKDAFKDPGAIASPRGKARSKTAFQHVEDVPELKATKGKARKSHEMLVPSSPDTTSKSPKSEFRSFDLPDFASSNGAESHAAPDVFESPEKSARQRSGSTSSLSSVDDMYLLAHGHDYNAEPELESGPSLCPVCEKPVHDSASLFVPANLRTLPYQQQKKFCSQHTLADAKEEWKTKGYPKQISWEELGSVRIRSKLPHLKKVISRNTECFYLDQLDAEIKSAKGNRRKIRNYLNEGLINVAKAGYYGPKGTHVMVDAITELLSATLTDALKSDSALRVTGVGAYVTAVLLPELTLRLVMDDMKLSMADEGRRVLDESTDIGQVLNPDDDQIQ